MTDQDLIAAYLEARGWTHNPVENDPAPMQIAKLSDPTWRSCD